MQLVSIKAPLAHFPGIDKIAVGIAIYQEFKLYPDFLGHAGAFERNKLATQSNLFKFHIALLEADFNAKSWKSNANQGDKRTSDNFVLYVQHYWHENFYQILDILTPEAHSRIDVLLPQYIEQAEQFHSLRLMELQALTNFSVEHQLAKQLMLTK
ncbi:type II toxin-antitoxin system YafO family toxin [Actinobacillus porcinus]|uniref:type II toxin-antitoxin system YafO family toxin n=1 Tax=Actinobacillus porcinus TaxID=51048 RepID=UPI0023528D0E|nr:type II toxin-antitoxin system YafO family toxin [Actinobacillus porcinus]MCI5764348.1 type II toxin-antitoxin system YafO family toxin [Actinobacillus porcinus]MDY5421779.1 type II toxin-antitoxin system YafO family toxin [Actinobacillus porcinus]MDY6216878.1 type II toxin-antitoxin system YafO family toxin [Actinobacillus porcinus]